MLQRCGIPRGAATASALGRPSRGNQHRAAPAPRFVHLSTQAHNANPLRASCKSLKLRAKPVVTVTVTEPGLAHPAQGQNTLRAPARPGAPPARDQNRERTRGERLPAGSAGARKAPRRHARRECGERLSTVTGACAFGARRRTRRIQGDAWIGSMLPAIPFRSSQRTAGEASTGRARGGRTSSVTLASPEDCREKRRRGCHFGCGCSSRHLVGRVT
ncbi:hypothetical protein OH77DRAFT_488296 [Trametes cingulata]|nr:hypothetical protein OH77DRAFT_488296 [Trametes cingulata]